MMPDANYAAQVGAIRQRLSGAVRSPALHGLLEELLSVFEAHAATYARAMTAHEALMATHRELMATMTTQTNKLEEQRATIRGLLAERERLLALVHGRLQDGPLLLCQACGAAME